MYLACIRTNCEFFFRFPKGKYPALANQCYFIVGYGNIALVEIMQDIATFGQFGLEIKASLKNKKAL